ncbi:MAG: RluA family pseudouridine synthase [Candidatus Omnitrophica bacterium]|nr:RluA family pseudouridine synthase [Candidatus Omnitrophota bacterium]
MSVPIPVLYEDKSFMLFDKPSGLLVVPDPRKTARTLEDIVNEQHPLTPEGRLHPCHRLDRETSGVIIFARGKANQEKMIDEFRKGTVHKKYIAFVRGKMKNPAGEIKSVIRDFHEKKRSREQKRFGGRSATPQGKPAVTRYKVVCVKHLFTVVDVFPLTGRTNQIRIHLGEIGHPILGERLYAFGKDFPVKFKRVALHAAEVGFIHPLTGKKISVVAELAKDMENFLNRY